MLGKNGFQYQRRSLKSDNSFEGEVTDSKTINNSIYRNQNTKHRKRKEVHSNSPIP